MNTIETFRCVRLDTKLTRTSCGARYTRAAKEHAGKTARGAMKLAAAGCVGCDIGKAHRRGEAPTAWPDGTSLEFVQLRVPAPPTPPLREEPPEPTPALPPSQDVRGAPREAEAEHDQERDVQSAKDELDRRLDELLLSKAASSEERSEPPADPQTSPAPAAPRRAPPALRPRTCKACENVYQPRGGRQKWCDACRALPPSKRTKVATQRRPASTAAALGADLQRTLDDAQRRFGPAVPPPATAHPRERVERLLDLQVEVRAQLRALAGPGTPHDLADVYAAAAAELAAYQAIRGGRA